MYHERKRAERESELTKLTGWHAAICVSNLFSETPKRSYEEIFPVEVDEPDEDPELLYEKCRLHGLPLPRKE